MKVWLQGKLRPLRSEFIIILPIEGKSSGWLILEFAKSGGTPTMRFASDSTLFSLMRYLLLILLLAGGYYGWDYYQNGLAP
ncbi:MAG: hypothetical protein AAHT63_02905, partial [Akkermansia muciniphila]